MLDVIVNWGIVLLLCTDHEHFIISLLATYVYLFLFIYFWIIIIDIVVLTCM